MFAQDALKNTCTLGFFYRGVSRSLGERDNFVVIQELLLGTGGAQRGEALLQHVGLLQEDLQSRGILWHVQRLCRSADKLFLPFFLYVMYKE